MLTTNVLHETFEWNNIFGQIPKPSITKVHRKMSWNFFIRFVTYSIEMALSVVVGSWKLILLLVHLKRKKSHLCRVWWTWLCNAVWYCLIRWSEHNWWSDDVGVVEHWTALLSRFKNAWLLQIFSLTTHSSPAMCQNKVKISESFERRILVCLEKLFSIAKYYSFINVY